MHRHSILVAVAIAYAPPCCADTIKVYNTVDHPVFTAVYYETDNRAERSQEIIEIAGHSGADITRPERKCKQQTLGTCSSYFDRKLFVSAHADDLTPSILLRQPHAPPPSSGHVGSLDGSTFYIYQDEALRVANQLAWNLNPIPTLTKHVKKVLFPHLDKVRAEIEHMDYPGKGISATVTPTSSHQLAPDEARFRTTRLARVTKQAFVDQLGLDPQATAPTVGLVVSGGGCRAMISCMSFLSEANTNGLLPIIMYLSALSGSTWGSGAFMYTPESSSQVYLEQLQQWISVPTDKRTTKSEIQSGLTWAEATKGRVGSIDLYGIGLGSLLHINDPRQFWGERSEKIEQGSIPFVILNLATPASRRDEYTINEGDYYHLLFLDPYRTEHFNARLSVPSFALGRVFRNGTSVRDIPPLTLAYVFGACGSAMSINLEDLIRMNVKASDRDFADSIQSFIMQHDIVTPLVRSRGFYTSIPDFTDRSGTGRMRIFDAGFAGVLPFTPLLEPKRTVDCIIALDVGDSPIYRNLTIGAENAKLRGQKFPSIPKDLAAASNQTENGVCLICEDPDPTVPMVIYLAIPQEPGASMLFYYTPEKSDQLANQVKGLLRDNLERIKKAIGHRVRKQSTIRTGTSMPEAAPLQSQG